MSIKRNWPYTPEDLQAIASRVDEIIAAVAPDNNLPDDDWRWGLNVEVWIDGFLVGHVKPYGDGYLGFYPLEVPE